MNKVLVFLFSFVFAVCFVNAEITVDGDSSKNVTVGSVETPVYEVYVSWNDLVYDWAYLADTGAYGWKVPVVCGEHYFDDATEFNNYAETIFTDETCTVELNQFTEGTYYYHVLEQGNPYIYIEDASQGGAVTPSIAFAAANGYDFTTMSFTYKNNSGNDVALTTSAVPNEARLCMKGGPEGPSCEPDEYRVYSLSPVIGIDTTKTITTPTAGATIGTITLTFATN